MFRITRLRKGETVYHGTSAEEDFDDPIPPFWVSDSEDVADWFKDWTGGERPRIIEYLVTETVELVALHSLQDMEMVGEDLGLDSPIDHRELIEALCDNGYGGWIIPDNYETGADIALCDPSILEVVDVYRSA